LRALQDQVFAENA
jgi:hypothetical protein